MTILLENIHNCYMAEENNMDAITGMETIADSELLTESGTILNFMKNNSTDFINLFGSKNTSELLEESQSIYRELTESIGVTIEDQGGLIKNIWDTIQKNSQTISAIALAAIVMSGAYKVYKTYFTKAAKACKGLSGDEKETCMLDYEERALNLQKTVLKKSLDYSDKSTDPKNFKKKIQIQISKLDKSLKKLKK